MTPESPATLASAGSRRRDVALGVLDAVVGVNAIGGAAYALGGAKDWPREWLDGTPFTTYRVPGLILGLVHAPINLWAANQLLRRRPRATLAALAAGAVQVGWIVIQARLIGVRSFLQPLLGAVGVVSLAAAVGRVRDGAAPPTGGGAGRPR